MTSNKPVPLTVEEYERNPVYYRDKMYKELITYMIQGENWAYIHETGEISILDHNKGDK